MAQSGRYLVDRFRPFGFLVVWAALLAGSPAHGQDLTAGKSGAELFAQNCTMCHRSARGLIKTAHAFSLNSFLRQHYTTSANSANLLAAYLRSADTGAAPAARQRGREGEERAAKSSRGRPETGERPSQRETKATRKQRQERSAARPADAADDNKETLQQLQDRSAARPPAGADEERLIRRPPPPQSAAPVREPPARSDKEAEGQPSPAWTPALEARLPPPVEPAAPSGLEPGTPVRQPAFSSPVP
jgi:hypothetical protein